MGHALPREVIETMDDKFIYQALKDCFWVSEHLPRYDRLLADGYPQEFIEAIEELSVEGRDEVATTTIIGAHERWRQCYETVSLLISDKCQGCLNVFAPSQLAGPRIYGVWARKFERMLKPAGFDFNQAVDLPGYGSQLNWMDQFDCTLQKFFKMGFLVARRKYAEENGLFDVGDLYRFNLAPRNDVMKLCSHIFLGGAHNMGAVGVAFGSLYYDHQDGLAYPYTRQMILENGGGAPLTW